MAPVGETDTDANKGNPVQATRARRASRPKVKTGCNICKIRRVKCDETRPQCNNCIRSGRTCEGYPAYKRVLDTAIPIAPRPGGGSISIAASSTSGTGSLTSALTVRPTVVRKLQRPINTQRPVYANRAAPKAKDAPSTTAIVKVASPTRMRPIAFSFDAQEGQYFQVFRTHTASELSGFFDSEFWTRSVLQESHSQASIRHAVVALGALYKTLETATNSPPGSPDSGNFDTAPNHYSFAVRQYSKAITRLRESLENNETRSQRTVLISIVLFTCFQSFTGDHEAAITQIQLGLGLLEERRQDSRQPVIPRKDEIVEDELIQMFTRLAIQAKSYDMAFHFPHPFVIRLSASRQPHDPTSPQSPSSPSDAASSSSVSLETEIPEVFKTSQDARQSLDALTERMMRFNELLSSYHQGPNNILPRSVQSSGLGFVMKLKQWGKAFEPLSEARRHPGVTNTERAGIDVLKMLHIMTSILFQTAFSLSEAEFDNYTPYFKEIVDLGKEVVVDEELTLAMSRCGDEVQCRHKEYTQISKYRFPGMASHSPGAFRGGESYSHIRASFALDLGIVPPLFVAATKCRNRKIRRDAIELLCATPRREGMWDSILCGRVGQWIMEVEEEVLSAWTGPSSPSALEIVPDERRVMVKEILFNMQKREATLKCGTRGTRDGEVDMRARETHIWW